VKLTLGHPSQCQEPGRCIPKPALAMATFPLPTLSPLTKYLPCVSLLHLLPPEANPFQGPLSIEDYNWRRTHSRGLPPRKTTECALLMLHCVEVHSHPVTYRDLGIQPTGSLAPVHPAPSMRHSTVLRTGLCLLSWSLALLVLHWMTSWDLVLMAKGWRTAGKVGLALFSFLVFFDHLTVPPLCESTSSAVHFL